MSTEKNENNSAVITVACRELKCSQYALADKLGVDRRLVYMWAKRKSAIPLWVIGALAGMGVDMFPVVAAIVSDYPALTLASIQSKYRKHDKSAWKPKAVTTEEQA